MWQDMLDPALSILVPVGAGLLLLWLSGIRYIPNNRIGIIEKFWSFKGSLAGGQIIALDGEAGYQSDVLRGGLHFGFFPWQYRIHREPLVTIAESRIGYVYARGGRPLPPIQTLGRTVECGSFQDARAFLTRGGERGRQRALLREGVYAINQALFVVIAEDRVYEGPAGDRGDKRYASWQAQLSGLEGFRPVLVGHGGRQVTEKVESMVGGADLTMTPSDTIGVVTVQDGASIESGQIIAPEVARDGTHDHNYFQDAEAFLALGGRRGKQLQVLTDGTYFINRWFATVETRPKTLVPIGYVGVIVSYYGERGRDVTGAGFRYGEQVDEGYQGVWKNALAPGKYPLNPYALKMELVPTVNFVLRWVTGLSEAHQYDRDLTSIDLVTADGYEPVLPLSLVLHIDYARAPSVVQRFGDVRRLITQTLDPILTAYFRDVAQTSHMLDLLTRREEIQKLATAELGRRFQEFDINCIAVLIGRPETKASQAGKGEDPIERLFDQLRMRRLAEEQIATFQKQEEAAVQRKVFNDVQAAADKQAELTATRIDIEVAANRGAAELAQAERLAKRDIARAFGESRSRELLGRGESARIAQTGLAEAAVSLQKVRAYGDPRIFALSLMSDQFSRSTQPLVPERLMILGNGTDGDRSGGGSMFERLMTLLLAEKGGLGAESAAGGVRELEEFTAEMTRSLKQSQSEGDDGALNVELERLPG